MNIYFVFQFTFALCIIGCILISSYAFIDSSGSAIQCMLDKGAPIPPKAINRYCWVQSTFTLPQHFEGEPGEEFIYWGVGKSY